MLSSDESFVDLILLSYYLGQAFNKTLSNATIKDIYTAGYPNVKSKKIYMDRVLSTAGGILQHFYYNQKMTEQDKIFFTFLRIAKAHCFFDGNKRCAFITSLFVGSSMSLETSCIADNYIENIDPILTDIIAEAEGNLETDSSLYKKLQTKFFDEFLFKKINATNSQEETRD